MQSLLLLLPLLSVLTLLLLLLLPGQGHGRGEGGGGGRRDRALEGEVETVLREEEGRQAKGEGEGRHSLSGGWCYVGVKGGRVYEMRDSDAGWVGCVGLWRRQAGGWGRHARGQGLRWSKTYTTTTARGMDTRPHDKRKALRDVMARVSVLHS